MALSSRSLCSNEEIGDEDVTIICLAIWFYSGWSWVSENLSKFLEISVYSPLGSLAVPGLSPNHCRSFILPLYLSGPRSHHFILSWVSDVCIWKYCKVKLNIFFKCSYILFMCCMRAKSLQSCLALWNPVNCSPSGSSVHGILQARIPKWVAMPSFKGSSWHRNWTHVFCSSCISGRFSTAERPWKPIFYSHYIHIIINPHVYTEDS